MVLPPRRYGAMCGARLLAEPSSNGGGTRVPLDLAGRCCVLIIPGAKLDYAYGRSVLPPPQLSQGVIIRRSACLLSIYSN